MYFDAVLLYAAVLYVDYLAQTYGVFVLTDCAADNTHGLALHLTANLVVAHDFGLLGYYEVAYSHGERYFTLDFDPRALLVMHYLAVYDLTLCKVHTVSHFKCRCLGNALARREEHREHNRTVCEPFHLGTDEVASGLVV